MAITLTLEPEVEAELLVRAQAKGMALQEYLQSIIRQEARQGVPSPRETTANQSTLRQEAISRMLQFGDRYHLSLGEPISRALLHEGHRL